MPPKPLITVTETGTASSKTVKVEVNPDPINLTGEGHGAVPIQWAIDPKSSPGWSFAANGIGIRNPSKKFAHGGPANGNKHYTWTRNPDQADGQPYKYSISVSDGISTVILDPSIINQS